MIIKFAGTLFFSCTYIDQQIQYWHITNDCYSKHCCHCNMVADAKTAEIPHIPSDPARRCAAPAVPSWPVDFAGPEQDSTA